MSSYLHSSFNAKNCKKIIKTKKLKKGRLKLINLFLFNIFKLIA